MVWRIKIPYLAGTMTGLKGYGRGWRKSLCKWFAQHGVRAYDPCVEETKEHKKYDLTHIPLYRWERLPSLLQEEILKKDLNQIKNNTNFLICYFTRYTTGTISELTFAYYHQIPIYIITTRRLRGWPYTISNAVPNKVFRTFEDLKRYLKVKYGLRKR